MLLLVNQTHPVPEGYEIPEFTTLRGDQQVDSRIYPDLQEKWGIGVIDLFNNPDMTALYGTDQYNSYMYDEVHPNRAGYVEWWTPVIDAYLTDFFARSNNG